MATPKSSKPLAGGCLTLFGLPFLAAGLFMGGFYFHGYAKWWAARSWMEVPCWIDSAELNRNSGSDSDTYEVLATYHYEYNGRTYQGKRVALHKGSDNIGDFQRQAHRELSRYAKGKPSDSGRRPFRCYVNPENPAESVIYRTLRWQMQAFIAVFALTFPAVGAGLVIGSLISIRTAKREAALAARHPGEPWKCKLNWAEPIIPESTTGGTRVLITYTIWAALVIAPLIVAAALTGAFQTDRMAWLLLIFVVIWCVPAWYTLKRLRHWLAVGKTRFELQESPAAPGGMLRGHVLLAKPPPPRGALEFTLVCEKRTTRSSGDGNTTSSEKRWSHQEIVPQDRILRDITGFRLPVGFTLPADAPESGADGDPSVEHRWKLEFKVPGTAIRSEFEVPVFRTGRSPAVKR